jgi:hypothetical protein
VSLISCRRSEAGRKLIPPSRWDVSPVGHWMYPRLRLLYQKDDCKSARMIFSVAAVVLASLILWKSEKLLIVFGENSRSAASAGVPDCPWSLVKWATNTLSTTKGLKDLTSVRRLTGSTKD